MQSCCQPSSSRLCRSPRHTLLRTRQPTESARTLGGSSSIFFFSCSTGLASLAVMGLLVVIGCGPSGDDEGESPWPEKREPRYSVSRVHNTLIRLDRLTGEMWITPHTAAGGWRPAGESADPTGADADEAAAPVYSVHPLDPKLMPLGAARYVMRANHVTGQAWVGKLSVEPNWREIPKSGGTVEAGATKQNGPTFDLPVLSKEALDSAITSKEDAEAFAEAISKQGLPVQVRVWATLQLGQLEPDVAVPPLLIALEDDEPEVVVAAITALRNTGVASTIPMILKQKDHPDERVRAAVSQEIIEGN